MRVGFLKNFSIAAIGLGLLITACNKPGIIGLDVQPKGDQFNVLYSDTSSLISYTVREDSLRSDEPIYNLLGSYNDPVFGYSAASFYTQFSLPTNDVDFGNGDGFKPDSLVLKLGYVDNYGDAPTAQTVNVYRLTEMMYEDSAYYSNRDFVYDDLIDLANFSIAPQDSTTVISIKLNNVIFSSNDSIFADTDALQLFLKGFYIATDTTQLGGILYFDMFSSNTKLTLYYDDSMSFDFEVDLNSARSNRFSRDYSGTNIITQLSDTTLGDFLVYVQPMAGVKTKIMFPYLKNWVQSQTIVVNSAELVLSVDAGSIGIYDPPDNLFILGAGEDLIITDQNEGASYFGGAYNDENKEYVFNIARHVHEILYEGKQDEGIYLIVPNNLLVSGSVVSANRVVLGGAKNTALQMKLKLTYTLL